LIECFYDDGVCYKQGDEISKQKCNVYNGKEAECKSEKNGISDGLNQNKTYNI
jgi:hypothetical protein